MRLLLAAPSASFGANVVFHCIVFMGRTSWSPLLVQWSLHAHELLGSLAFNSIEIFAMGKSIEWDELQEKRCAF